MNIFILSFLLEQLMYFFHRYSLSYLQFLKTTEPYEQKEMRCLAHSYPFHCINLEVPELLRHSYLGGTVHTRFYASRLQYCESLH